MQVSVETLDGLERKITVSVPTEKIEEEVSLRLKDLARKAKIHGFRPGKAPISAVKNRYSDNVREDVARELVQTTLHEALTKEALTPAGLPYVEPQQLEAGKDFVYSATFEVYPSFDVVELDENVRIEAVQSQVTQKDVDDMLLKLREQNKTWDEVSRPVEKNDKLVIDFEGFINEEPFEGNKAQDFEVVIGSGSMIPGFEDALMGHEQGQPFDIHVTFPTDYFQKELADKDARFTITIKKIMEGKLPELDDAFVSKFNIQEGGLDAFRKDIQENMERELERRVSSLNRDKIFEAFLDVNPFELPKTMLDKEIENLKHEMYHLIFGHDHSDDEKIPNFPRELFEARAKRRVHLGLLLSEYVKKHQLVADKDRVEAAIEKLASAYEHPEQLRSWFKEDKQRMGDIEALVMEEMVAEKIRERAQLKEKKMSYDEVMNPKKEGK